MTWGLFILLIVIFICISALLFLQIEELGTNVELYLIFVVVVLFIILIFAIDFDNPITTTFYLSAPSTNRTLIYNVPYNDDTSFANLMSLNFDGVYSPANAPVNNTPGSDSVVFNYDTFTTASILGGALTVTKLPNYQIQVDIVPGGESLVGFVTLKLLCTGSQNINSSFSQV